MSTVSDLLHALVIINIQYLYKINTLNIEPNNIIGDTTKHSACVTDNYDVISSFYNEIIYDPRIDINNKPPKLTCKNRTIWISEDTKYVIYYQSFTDAIISGFNNAINVSGFGIFECSQNSYLTALKSQSADILSNNMCIDPQFIYPDAYPSLQCKGKPIIYCLPFKDTNKCPQFQMTMTSMYNAIDLKKDLILMHNFHECNCWYKPNDEGDTNHDERITIKVDFNENCKQIMEEKMKNKNEQYIKSRRDSDQNLEEEMKEEHEEEIEIERDREFSILWATLGFIIGVILLIIVVIYSCRKQYEKKMYLTSRKYYRYAHSGDVENDNLIRDSSTESDTDSGSTYDTDSDTNLSNELAYDDENLSTCISENI
eukprot:243317_1